MAEDILKSGELQEVAVCKNFLHTASDGKKLKLVRIPYKFKSMASLFQNETSCDS